MAGCCCASSSSSSSSHGLLLLHRRRSLLTSITSLRPSPATLRPGRPRAPHPHRLSCSFPQEPPPLDADCSAAAADQRIGFEIQVSKAGKRNRRLVRARVRVDAPLEAVWATLTDYERLADFIPGLAECRLLDQAQGFARLYQVGEQDLALGFKFNAKGTIDCYEGDMEEALPDAPRRREISFNMVDGDFKLFQGKWSVVQEEQQQGGGDSDKESHAAAAATTTTTLSYLVELEPKLWVPVSLLEGRICSEIKNNLVSIREQAQRRHYHSSDQ